MAGRKETFLFGDQALPIATWTAAVDFTAGAAQEAAAPAKFVLQPAFAPGVEIAGDALFGCEPEQLNTVNLVDSLDMWNRIAIFVSTGTTAGVFDAYYFTIEWGRNVTVGEFVAVPAIGDLYRTTATSTSVGAWYVIDRPWPNDFLQDATITDDAIDDDFSMLPTVTRDAGAGAVTVQCSVFAMLLPGESSTVSPKRGTIHSAAAYQ